MAASSLALVDDRLAFLVSKLPAEEILKIALHGICNSAATRSFATERHAETYPLPQWCVSDVLLSADLLPKIFSSLSLRDGGRASGACPTWNRTWKAVRQERTLKHEKTVGPALPWVERHRGSRCGDARPAARRCGRGRAARCRRRRHRAARRARPSQ